MALAALAFTAFGVVITLLTFWRMGIWRREDLGRAAAERDKNQTEVVIRQIDQEARTGVKELLNRFQSRADSVDRRFDTVTDKMAAEVSALHDKMTTQESDLRNAVQTLDSRIRTKLDDQGSTLAAVVEAMRHSPTQSDLASLRETMGKLSGQVEANGVRTEGVSQLLARIDTSVQRIEEHHFRDR